MRHNIVICADELTKSDIFSLAMYLLGNNLRMEDVTWQHDEHHGILIHTFNTAQYPEGFIGFAHEEVITPTSADPGSHWIDPRPMRNWDKYKEAIVAEVLESQKPNNTELYDMGVFDTTCKLVATCMTEKMYEPIRHVQEICEKPELDFFYLCISIAGEPDYVYNRMEWVEAAVQLIMHCIAQQITATYLDITDKDVD